MSEIQLPKNELTDFLVGSKAPYALLGVGIPGSGKTSVLKQMAETLQIPRINADEIRAELLGDEADQAKNHEVWEAVYKRAEESLDAGIPVIIDATHIDPYHPTDKQREVLRPALVKKYQGFGAKAVIAAVFATPLEVAKHNNQQRDRIVPDYVLERMHNNLQKRPVALNEGFDLIAHRATIDATVKIVGVKR